MVVILGTIIVFQYVQSSKNINTDVCIKYEIITNGGKSTPIGQKSCVMSLEKVDTTSGRESGLSGREFLPANRGMLFVFDSIGNQCMWMKDMKFNLDIAWLNAHGDVVKLEEKLTPASYPQIYCADDTLFVIEVNSGIAKSAGLDVGSHVTL